MGNYQNWKPYKFWIVGFSNCLERTSRHIYFCLCPMFIFELTWHDLYFCNFHRFRRCFFCQFRLISRVWCWFKMTGMQWKQCWMKDGWVRTSRSSSGYSTALDISCWSRRLASRLTAVLRPVRTITGSIWAIWLRRLVIDCCQWRVGEDQDLWITGIIYSLVNFQSSCCSPALEEESHGE